MSGSQSAIRIPCLGCYLEGVRCIRRDAPDGPLELHGRLSLEPRSEPEPEQRRHRVEEPADAGGQRGVDAIGQRLREKPPLSRANDRTGASSSRAANRSPSIS